VKYQANPVLVNAYRILEIEGASSEPGVGATYNLVIGDGESENQRVTATPGMTARMTPTVGDYWVVQSDGYIYLNPKDVFERKYHRADDVIEIDAHGNISGPPGSKEFLAGVNQLRQGDK